MRRSLRVACSCTLAVAVLAITASLNIPALAGSATTTFINWPAYLFGSTHHSDNSAAVTITPATAPALTRVWSWKPAAPTMTGQPGPTLFASPTVFNGHVFIGANTGVFYALDEATGKVIWKRFLGFVTKKTCGARGLVSTATVARDPVTGAPKVYVAGADGYLYALSAATGAITWRHAVALPSSRVNNYYNWSSPTVFNGRVYIGVSSQCDNPLVMGGLKEYNQATGALVAFFKTNPGGSTGPSIWTSAAGRQSGTSVFVTTGNGAGRDAIAVIRLNAATLAQQGSWQVPSSEHGFDSDFGGSPTLFSATIGGSTVQLVGACNKNGVYYTLRRGNLAAGPVWRFQAGTPTTVSDRCDAASVWDGSNLYVAANQTVIGGVTYNGSVRSLDPATGRPRWQRGLPGAVVGSPTLDGAGVLAVPTFSDSGLFLVNATTGSVLKNIPTGPEFGQPVFADTMLLVPTKKNGLWAYRPVG
jgi:outer membrane protein assembly factor BamB